MSSKLVQDIFRTRHILVTDSPCQPMAFDATALLTLAYPDKGVIMQGLF